MTQGPILFDLEPDKDRPSPAEAPPVPDPQPVALPEGQAMQAGAALATRRPSGLARWFFGLLGALVAALLSVAAWEAVAALTERAPIVGWAITALAAALVVVGLVIALRELAALSRLRRIDRLHRQAEAVRQAGELEPARALLGDLERFYAGREDTSWGRARLAELRGDVFDADAALTLAEDCLLVPLDNAARAEVEAAARQVAAVTALVPLALADMVTALAVNLRMIRRIAEIYGGRSGFWGGWRLTRAVFGHLVATGAVALGDDMLDHLVGGSILSRLSRRFGEGLVNGALTARVGLAAMEVCRPLPFGSGKRPSMRGLVRGALGGMLPDKKD